MHKLSLLDVSHNNLKSLPTCIGCLKCLQVLSLEGNCGLTHLPQSLCHIANTLRSIKLDIDKVTHPPPEVTTKGTQEILKYLCKGKHIICLLFILLLFNEVWSGAKQKLAQHSLDFQFLQN